MLGSQASEVALLVQAKQLTGSPLAVGLLGVVELVPLVVFGLYGGALADRFDRRALMRWCELGLGCCAVLLLVNGLLPRPAVWPLYAVSAVMMALVALQRPSFDASVPRLVRREQLTAASALLSMSQNVSFILGSSLGGVLAAAPGPWLVYGLDAASFAVSFGFLTRLRPIPRSAATDAATEATTKATTKAATEEQPPPTLRGILAGVRYAFARQDLLGSYLADLAAMIFAYPNALFPFMASLLRAPWATGLMFAAPSAGAIGVTLLSGWMGRVRRHGRAIALAAAAWGVAMAGFGLSPDIYLALACLVAAGAADMVSGIFRDTLWNQTIPDELRGRLAGVELLSYGIGPPAGQLRSGVVASLTSVRFSLVSGGLLCVGSVAVVCAALPGFARYRAAVTADSVPAGAQEPAAPARRAGPASTAAAPPRTATGRSQRAPGS
jgi:MFS family permease